MEKFSTLYQKIHRRNKQKEVYEVRKLPDKCQGHDAADKNHCDINGIIKPVSPAAGQVGKSLYAEVTPPDESGNGET